jgi:hypothetical protein
MLTADYPKALIPFQITIIRLREFPVYTQEVLAKSEIVTLLGQNLQLISSFQKLPPVKVNKLFHCIKSYYRHDLICIQWINFRDLSKMKKINIA